MTRPTRVLFAQSAFDALLRRDHPDHKRARQVYERLLDCDAELWTTNYVVLQLWETHDPDTMAKLARALDQFFNLILVDQSIHSEAQQRHVRKDTTSLLEVISEVAARRIRAGLFAVTGGEGILLSACSLEVAGQA